MTQKDKELLLKDLCARLPFMPKIKITYHQQGIRGTDEGRVSCDFIEKIVNDLRNGVIIDMQIFLRPMSSMTDVEIAELNCLCYHNIDVQDGMLCGYVCADEMNDVIEFLNKNMFDYCGLIEKGLALEAPEGMY